MVEFRSFLREHVEDLKIHPPTTYQLLGSHGRRQEILLYASLIEDLDRVISFHIQEGNYMMALEVSESVRSLPRAALLVCFVRVVRATQSSLSP